MDGITEKTSSSLPTLYAPRFSKFTLMSITTFGLFLIYWGYKNWQIMKNSGRTYASAPLCGFFLPFTLFSLLDKVHAEVQAIGGSRSKLTASAVGFLLLNVLKMIPIIGILFNMITFVAIIPVNQTFLRINEANQKSRSEYENFNKYNIGWLVLFASWFTFHLVRYIVRGMT